MYSSASVLLLAMAAFRFRLLSASARSFWKHHQHQHETLDAFKILSVNGSSVALRDVNQDPMFKCLTATFIDFDRDVPSATYQWSLNAGENAPRKNVTLHYTKGPSVDSATLVVDSECTLWARKTTEHIVPEECFKKHATLCGNGVSLYDNDTCGKL
uniref:Putative group ii salivary lipocalin n=1 Tax=Rhipicephalus pulchellus TaxID=72859 RepID=L7LT63_RHIPC